MQPRSLWTSRREFCIRRATPATATVRSPSFYWIMAALVILQFVLGFKVHGLPISRGRLVLLTHHESTGLDVRRCQYIQMKYSGTPTSVMRMLAPVDQGCT